MYSNSIEENRGTPTVAKVIIHKSGNVALIAHGGVCRAIIGTALGMPARNWLRLSQDYGCLNVIDWYDGNPILQLLNLGYSGACSDKALR
jgi:alpha-ribazole phosphatase